jgi:zinc/manganese transport system ATP-binding protein
MSLTSADTHRLVEFERVSCAYGDTTALVDINLRIAEGQFTGIVGPSGSGKSTLLKTLLGTMRPSTGTVHRVPGLRVGYVPQLETVDWNFPVTVGECVLMARTGGRVWPWRSRSERAEVDAVLERLEIASLADRHIRKLSGGQQQRVFVARALLGRPQLLLMDEPTSGVDFRTRHEILHLLGDLYGDGLAIVLTTHDLNGIAAHLPHLVCLNTEIIGTGPPRTVLTPDVLERTFGASIEVLEHAGMPVVVDSHRHVGANVIEFPGISA